MPQLTIQQAFALALRHHQAGQLQQAEQLYRQILAQQPGHADALHFLGLLAHQVGQNDMAVDLIHQALALKPQNSEAYSNLGIALKAKGQLNEAIAAYRQAITLKPHNLQAHSNLGIALKEQGHLDEAIAAYRQALALNPKLAEIHNNLGNALREKGQFDDAIAACRQAVTLRPSYAEAHNNLGTALRDKGQRTAAIAAFQQAIALNSHFAEAHNNLGTALRDQGQRDEAIADFRQAIALKPNFPDAHFNLGVTLKDQEKTNEAIAAFRQALALKPDYPEAHYNLGNALKAQGQLDAAISAFRQALALKPDYPAAHYNLGIALSDQGQIDAAVAAFRQAIALKFNFADAHNNLGNALKDQGLLDAALAAFRQAVALDPGDAMIHSNLLYTMLYHPTCDPDSIVQEHYHWNRRHAEPLRQFIQPHAHDRNPDRRLRIGYVSPDFREHPVGRNMLPLFRHMDREHFEVFCYANMTASDALTEEFRRQSAAFRMVAGMKDQALAEQIRADGIDILVDLALHTAGNRLPVFARKPAPVQATFAGYPGTTGMDIIDYRLTDPYLDPPEPGVDTVYAEKLLRLPATFWCYDPWDDMPVSPLPALANGYVTFGCLNNFCKVSADTLALWERVLAGVAGSRLVLLADEGSHRERTLKALEDLGVSRQCVRFESKRPRPEYLKLYQQIDIGLDTLPYNGHSTSMDSYMMGVPVVTLVGKTVVGRAGFSQLTNLGMPELIGQTEGHYVHIARDLASDLGRLAGIRAALRGRMQASPLMDGAAFARGIEAAYRQIWREWCAQAPALR